MRLFRFCGVFMMQLKGAAIGGPLSRIALSLVCNRLEDFFDNVSWPQLVEAWHIPHVRSKAFYMGRYVDDLITVSFIMCRGCLDKMLVTIYKGQMKFDDVDDYYHHETYIACKYLDAVLHISDDDAYVTHYHPNESWILHGRPADKQKNCIPEYLGNRPTEWIRTTARDLTCRRHRWKQLKLKDEHLVYSTYLDILQMLRERYPAKLIQRIWLSQKLDGTDKSAAITLLRACIAAQDRRNQNTDVNLLPAPAVLQMLRTHLDQAFRIVSLAFAGRDTYYNTPTW